MTLTKKVNGQTVTLTDEEKTAVEAQWAAEDAARAATENDPDSYPLNPFQFFTFLERAGLSEAMVDDAIDTVEPDADMRITHKRRFRHASSYRRDHPLLISLISAVGKTPAEIDTAWMAAKALT